MNKTIIILAVIVIGILGAFVLMDRTVMVEEETLPLEEAPVTIDRENGEVSDTEIEVIVVTYTDGGFDPAIVTVREGETVRFFNGSSRAMWIASNPHPAHTAYPGFDQLSSSGLGHSYEFTFDRVGSWGYHNHTFDRHGGTVVVTER